jgi:hypothetical protein
VRAGMLVSPQGCYAAKGKGREHARHGFPRRKWLVRARAAPHLRQRVAVKNNIIAVSPIGLLHAKPSLTVNSKACRANSNRLHSVPHV